MPSGKTINEVMRELGALEDPKMREANERRGDDHGVNLVSRASTGVATLLLMLAKRRC